MRLFLSFCILISGFSAPLLGQALSKNPLADKAVAVYVSKKQFSYGEHYNHLLSQFIKKDQGDDVMVDDIKLQSLVALGRLFAEQLPEAAKTRSCFFLNAKPELARAFIKQYVPEESKLAPLGASFANLDYILVVNPIVLSTYKSASVYTRSNRLITTYDMVKTGRIKFELYDPKTGQLVRSHNTCMDERGTKVPENYFSFYNADSKTGKFLSRMFSLGVYHLNQGIADACDEGATSSRLD